MTASANAQKAFWWDKNHLHLRCVIQTKSGKDEIVGLHGNEVKIRITEVPQDGKANKHLLRFLSRQFDVRNPKILPPLFNQ
jgi:uncharacterized protein (TIGR00251 family)